MLRTADLREERPRHGRQGEERVIADDLLQFLRELRPAQALPVNEIGRYPRPEGEAIGHAGTEPAVAGGYPVAVGGPCFRALNMAEDEIEFVYGKRRLAGRLETGEMRTHLREHGTIGIGFVLAEQ